MMETIILVISIGIMNILCFFIGAKVGQKVSRNETIKISSPIKAIQEAKEVKQETKQRKEEMEYYQVLMQNIDNYDGTGIGQRNLPNK